MNRRPWGLVLSLAFVALDAAPIGAQSVPATQASPGVQSPQGQLPSPLPSSAKPGPSTPPSGGTGAQTQPGVQTQPGMQSQPGMQTQPGTPAQPATGSAASRNANPPPPQPAILPPVPSIAPGYVAPNLGVPNGEIVGVAQTPFVGIGLQDAIVMALMRNTDLAIAQANRRIAGFQIVAAQGAYDVRFELVPSFQHSVQPPTSSFQSGPGGGPFTQDTIGASVGIQGRTEGGTQYRVSGSGSRVNTDLSVAGFSPAYPTALSFNLTQPLARGRNVDDARRQLALTRITADSNADQALLSASNVIASVSNTYWDLVAAWRNVAIQEEGLRTAQAQARSNERLARAGQAAPVEIIESNTQVDVFQDNVFSALQNVQRLQTQLKNTVAADPADPIWNANLVPSTSVAELPSDPTVDDVLIAALGNRPEIAQLRESRRSAAINVAFAKDQLKPQIDLGLGYTTNGYAGSPVDPRANPVAAMTAAQTQAINQLIAVVNRTQPSGSQLQPLTPSGNVSPAYLNGGVGQSVSNLFTNKFPTYAAQVAIGLPLRNRSAKGNYDAALEQDRALSVQQVGLIQRLKAESLNAVQALRTNRYRLVSARSARDAAERVYESEIRRFRAGTSTTFLVLQRALNLANNRGRELQAQTDLNKAIVELDRVRGGLFAHNRLDIDTLGAQTLRATGSTTAGASSGGTVQAAPAAPEPSQTIPPAVRP